jgi:putative FmdB family regulatory protein
MPTYEYECQKCGHTFELFQSMSDKPRQRCPKCRGKVIRLFGTGAGIIFKGSGFYQTDYRSSEYKTAEKKDKDTATSTAASKKDDKKASSSKKTKKDKAD